MNKIWTAFIATSLMMTSAAHVFAQTRCNRNAMNGTWLLTMQSAQGDPIRCNLTAARGERGIDFGGDCVQISIPHDSQWIELDVEPFGFTIPAQAPRAFNGGVSGTLRLSRSCRLRGSLTLGEGNFTFDGYAMSAANRSPVFVGGAVTNQQGNSDYCCVTVTVPFNMHRLTTRQ